MGNAVVPTNRVGGALVEKVLLQGDLKSLSPEERMSYYKQVCESVGLNPLTRPFEYLTLNGKLTLYARRDCTDQLRKLHNVSVNIVARERHQDVYVVTAKATMPDGRTDESIGAVAIHGLKGADLANALMKCETKGKRRVTLSICGLGYLDETEVEAVTDHAGPAPTPAKQLPPPKSVARVTRDQADELRSLLDYRNRCSAEPKTEGDLLAWVKTRTGLPGRASLEELSPEEYHLCKGALQKKVEKPPQPEREPGEDEGPEFEGGPEPEPGE